MNSAMATEQELAGEVAAEFLELAAILDGMPEAGWDANFAC